MEIDTFSGKSILVTGATGLLGSHIIERISKIKGTRVIALGRSLDKLKRTFCGIELLEHDISKPLPECLGRIDYIFHAASPISGDIIRTRPLDIINTNLSGTINCLEYLRKQKESGINGKIIVFSSATIYSNIDSIKIATEDRTNYADNLDTDNAPYSESKRMIEVIARAYRKQYYIDIIIARFSYVYGYSKNPAKTAFYDFIDRAIKGEDLILNNSGLPRRDNIYVEDAIDALIHICSLGVYGEAFNISSNGDLGNYAAIDEIAEFIVKSTNSITNSNIRVKYKTLSDSRTEGLRLDNSKLKSTGWHLSSSIRDGISDTIIKFLNK